MNSRRAILLDGALLVAAIVIAIAGGRAALMEPFAESISWSMPSRIPARTWPSADSLPQLSATILHSDPFRMYPAQVNPEPTSHASLHPQADSQRQLALIGIVGGPPWSAVIRGIEGRGTIVVHEGDVLASYRVARIAARELALSGDGVAASLILTLKTR